MSAIVVAMAVDLLRFVDPTKSTLLRPFEIYVYGNVD